MRICPRCGKQCHGAPYWHTCRRGRLEPITWRLGDRLHYLLSRLGITQARWIAAKQRLGLGGKCGCDGRRDWLNRL